ncbi:hypothetical protein KGF47_20875 [Clostridioides sp. ZZV13-5731]|nr:hypothetical protein [Clostridioides sp. ZZV13-5731]
MLKNCHLRILYSAKLSFKREREIKTYLGKQNLRDFITPRLAMKEM